MDTSKEYIKMCDRGEIQDRWEPEPGDWFAVPHKDDYVLILYTSEFMSENGRVYSGEDRFVYWDKCIWLPRQDQLQGMLAYLFLNPTRQEETDFITMSYYFHRFAQRNNTMHPNLKSMDQLWLAFVMWELHKKVWTGKEWQTKEV